MKKDNRAGQGFPFQMKREANGLLQLARTAHFSGKGANLTARVLWVSGDTPAWRGNPGCACSSHQGRILWRSLPNDNVKYLFFGSRNVTCSLIEVCQLFCRDHVESSLIKLWKALFNHLVNVVTNNVMNAQEVGNMFGHLLISKNSRFVTEVWISQY